MTREEYIEKQIKILKDSLKDTFKREPTKILLMSRNPRSQYDIEFGTKRCICLACENDKFYISHIRPRTLICSKCYLEKHISNMSLNICTDETKD